MRQRQRLPLPQNQIHQMSDNISKRRRSQVMAKVRARGNASTELRMIKLLRENNVTGWRRHLPMPGTPDFAFRRARLALFIDGCFWHGCRRCYRAPKSNSEYWSRKVQRNRQRDRQISRQLVGAGWVVLRVKECWLKSPGRVIAVIKSACVRSMNLH